MYCVLVVLGGGNMCVMHYKVLGLGGPSIFIVSCNVVLSTRGCNVYCLFGPRGVTSPSYNTLQGVAYVPSNPPVHKCFSQIKMQSLSLSL